MKCLIVNADDFGLCVSVNRGILEAHRHGLVTSATLLVTAPGFDDAVALAREVPDLGVGIHLNLTRGRPVSPPEAVPSLVGTDGTFAWGAFGLALALVRGRIVVAEVRREWTAQVDRMRAAGLAPTHLDSEKHVHLLPPLLDVAVELARASRIRGIRAGAEPGLAAPGAGAMTQRAKAIAIALLGRRARRRIVGASLCAPDRLLGILAGGRLDDVRLRKLLGLVGAGVTELICHPGYVGPDLLEALAETGGGYLVDAREREVRALTGQDLPACLRDWGIRLIHYGHL